MKKLPKYFNRNEYIGELSIKLNLKEEVFDRLVDRQVFILYHWFGLNFLESMTLEQIGNLCRVSRQRIHDQKNDALLKIRMSA
jgi:DNA-directed RNA polymerase sigma subunit (sigma70/sigma32)